MDEIKKEILRLKKIYKDLEGNKKKVAEGLIEDAAFMRKTLRDLTATIEREGSIDIMPQGEYSIKREHPAMRTYNSTIKNYTSIIKQLSDLLPKESQKVKDDGFDNFVINRDD